MGYRLSKIYTRKGDDGTTSLDGKNRLLKNALQIEAVGTLDEANCALGLVLTQAGIDEKMHALLTQIQHDLFNLGGELCPPHRAVITAEKIAWLEQQIDHWNETLPPLKEFLLPGGTPASANCHLARAICRRAERCLVALNQQEKLFTESLRYVNRLSDFLFVAARILAKNENCEEVLWEHQRK